MERVRRSVGFPNGINVTSVGSSGGLTLGWRNNVTISLRSFFAAHIDVLIDDDFDGNRWRYTSFYGAPQEKRREGSW